MEGRDAAMADVPNMFVQTKVEVKGDEKITMKMRGALMDVLEEINPSKYKGKSAIKNGRKSATRPSTIELLPRAA